LPWALLRSRAAFSFFTSREHAHDLAHGDPEFIVTVDQVVAGGGQDPHTEADQQRNELAAARDLMLTTGQRSATERVVSFLLAFSRRNERNGQDPSDFELPMTRADIGDFLGLTIETVSRTFTKLKTLGLIELPHSNRVKLLDIDELESLADGEDH
jgi:CRP-like cAMP-binding protein